MDDESDLAGAWLEELIEDTVADLPADTPVSAVVELYGKNVVTDFAERRSVEVGPWEAAEELYHRFGGADGTLADEVLWRAVLNALEVQ